MGGPTKTLLVGCMNVHIGNEYNRKVLLGMVSMLKLDVCVITETWLREGDGDRVMIRVSVVWKRPERSEELDWGWWGWSVSSERGRRMQDS